MNKYSNAPVSQGLLDEIAHSLQSIAGYGSLEIFVQNGVVTQITVRNIKKTLSIVASKKN